MIAAAAAVVAHQTLAAQQGSTIEGHVKLTGTPPPNALIKMGGDPNCLKINVGKRVAQETVLKGADGGLENVFVSVRGSFPPSPVPPTPIVIDQQACTYHPRVQGARVGQVIEVRNSDQTLHNIHSMSIKKNDFNTGQPLAGMVFKFKLKAEEVMLHVKCDVHSWMTGYIGIVAHPYFAVTDPSGTFRIANVPTGRHTIQVWHELYGPLTQAVDVKAGETTTVDFTFTGNEKPANPTGFAAQPLTIPTSATAARLIVPVGKI